MILTERHILTKNSNEFKIVDKLCFLSKNLYNTSLYHIKKEYKNSGKYLRYRDLEKYFRDTKNVDYFNIPTSSSQQILMLFDKNIKSFFQLLRKWKKDNKSLNGCPKFPKYKDKIKGRNIFIIRGDVGVSKLKEGYIHFPKKTGLNPIKTKIETQEQLKQVRIIPKSSCYVIEIVYEQKEKDLKISNNKKASIDLGINNLITLTTNITQSPLIINGKPLKSMNQYYNKKRSKIQENLKKNHNKYNSNKLNYLSLKRDNKIKDYLHKSSRFVVNYLIENNINELVIGYNKEWKQEIDIGKRNNQNFTSIPHHLLINMLEYKCKLEGINFKFREESYTSKCSSLDLEEISKHDNYFGKRTKRGLFITSTGKKINADVNGSLNIGRKEFGDEFIIPANIGLVLNPVKVNLY